MDLDLEDTESESDDEIWEDKLKPWKLITTEGKGNLQFKAGRKGPAKKRVKGEGDSG
jgi:hypothetical protein